MCVLQDMHESYMLITTTAHYCVCTVVQVYTCMCVIHMLKCICTSCHVHVGQLVKLLVFSGVTHYLELKPVDGSYVFKGGEIYNIPSNESEALSSSK